MLGLKSLTRPKPSATVRLALSGDYTVDEMAAIDRLGTVINLESGERFVVEGESGREVVLILHGTAAVEKNGETVATVTIGDIIGERAIVTGERRNASIAALTDMTVSVFTVAGFEQLLAESERLDGHVHALVDARS
ncbi:MAG: cyclic nucleotide-binding domain-containing protein [Actinomycetota bacterium]